MTDCQSTLSVVSNRILEICGIPYSYSVPPPIFKEQGFLLQSYLNKYLYYQPMSIPHLMNSLIATNTEQKKVLTHWSFSLFQYETFLTYDHVFQGQNVFSEIPPRGVRTRLL